jgi:hypothetical protein
MIKQPFCGELFVDDKKLAGNISLYINVTNDDFNNTQIHLFNAPPPFTFDSMIGKYGVKWRLKKIKRKFLVNQYLLNIMDDNFEAYCSTAHKFGDMLEQAITTLPQ